MRNRFALTTLFLVCASGCAEPKYVEHKSVQEFEQAAQQEANRSPAAVELRSFGEALHGCDKKKSEKCRQGLFKSAIRRIKSINNYANFSDVEYEYRLQIDGFLEKANKATQKAFPTLSKNSVEALSSISLYQSLAEASNTSGMAAARQTAHEAWVEEHNRMVFENQMESTRGFQRAIETLNRGTGYVPPR